MWGDGDQGGSELGRQDANRDGWGNPSHDAWGNATDRNGWGDIGRDSQGNDWSYGSSDVGSAGDSGGLLDALGDFLGGLFG